MTESELERFLTLHNEYSNPNWRHRLEQISVIQETIESFAKIGRKEANIKKEIKHVQEKSYDTIIKESARAARRAAEANRNKLKKEQE